MAKPKLKRRPLQRAASLAKLRGRALPALDSASPSEESDSLRRGDACSTAANSEERCLSPSLRALPHSPSPKGCLSAGKEPPSGRPSSPSKKDSEVSAKTLTAAAEVRFLRERLRVLEQQNASRRRAEVQLVDGGLGFGVACSDGVFLEASQGETENVHATTEAWERVFCRRAPPSPLSFSLSNKSSPSWTSASPSENGVGRVLTADRRSEPSGRCWTCGGLLHSRGLSPTAASSLRRCRQCGRSQGLAAETPSGLLAQSLSLPCCAECRLGLSRGGAAPSDDALLSEPRCSPEGLQDAQLGQQRRHSATPPSVAARVAEALRRSFAGMLEEPPTPIGSDGPGEAQHFSAANGSSAFRATPRRFVTTQDAARDVQPTTTEGGNPPWWVRALLGDF